MASAADVMAGGTVWSAFTVPKGYDGGSFWQMFGDSDLTGTSPLDVLLESPDCSIEALMDEEDLIQEFKARNGKLVARLCRPDAALRLVDFITREPAEGASSSHCFTYPFVAMQLMMCGVDEFFDVWVNGRHKEILDRFWGFLDVTSPSQVNPVLAGYFSFVAAALFRRYPEEVARSLRERGADAIYDRFVERLHSRSIAELFTRLVCAEHPAERVFESEGLVSRLLSLIKQEGLTSDTVENLAMVLRELFARRDTICFTDDLIRDFSSRSTIDLLMTHSLGEDVSRASAAISILFSAVFHTSNEEIQATFPIYQPLAPPPVSFVGEEMPNVGFAGHDADVDEAIPAKIAVKNAVRSLSDVSLNMDSLNDRLVDFVCSHFARVGAFLDGCAAKEVEVSTPVGKVKRVGSATLELIFLLGLLARTDRGLVLPAFHREQLLPRCFKIMLRHPWSSLLHNATSLLLSEVLATADDAAVKLVLGFCGKGGIIEDMVAEYAAQRSFDAEGRQRRPRVGYMGQLTAFCCELREFSIAVPECAAAVASVKGWSDIVLPAVSDTLKMFREELGGGVPQEERGLASTSMTWPGIAASPAAYASDE
eukprot:CAMPEP_0195065816 /NCGR_PEP_ID=MMETSP0448-20130528/11349_1 /TAXON_ID=66468 /ORGANISM="Heterocapsa triquestra, Strain CCMP 448" /LENGTH=595 /DNA_ID=CAMNT_0040096967 /DNA_START=58 /DNA_END=1842 /DNA_ORIENTATION=+